MAGAVLFGVIACIFPTTENNGSPAMVIAPPRPAPLLRLAHFVADGVDDMPSDNNNNTMLDPVVSGEWSMVESSESPTPTEIEPGVVVEWIVQPRPGELCDVCSGPFRRGNLQVTWHTKDHQVIHFHEECTITYASRRGAETQVDMMTNLVAVQPRVHPSLHDSINSLCFNLAKDPEARDGADHADAGDSQAAGECEGDGEEQTFVVTSPFKDGEGETLVLTSPCQDGKGDADAEALAVSSPARGAGGAFLDSQGEMFLDSQPRTPDCWMTPDPKGSMNDSQFASPEGAVPDTLPYSPMQG